MLRKGLGATLALALCAPAQWLNYTTPGIPRLADGSPDLSAAAPKTPEGKPDLSGIWRSDLTGNDIKYISNIATDLQPEEIQPWAEAISKQHRDNLGREEPWARCLPAGLPLLDTAGLTYRIIQTRGLVAILYEETSSVPRMIQMDGRTLPKDPNPSWLGYSVGRWEGDALVVETIGFNDRTWLDTQGHPHSESLKVTESFRRQDFGHMELKITIDDPKAFTRPFTVIKHPKLRADYEMLEYVCNENERDSQHMVGK